MIGDTVEICGRKFAVNPNFKHTLAGNVRAMSWKESRMVHVKEYGQKPGDRKFESRCKTCGSIIAFTESEAENRTGPRPDDNLLVVKCPVCKGEVYGYPST